MLPSLPPVTPIRSTQPTFFYLELDVLVAIFEGTTNVFVECYQQLDNRYHNVSRKICCIQSFILIYCLSWWHS